MKKKILLTISLLLIILIVYALVGFLNNGIGKDAQEIRQTAIKCIELNQTLSILPGDLSKSNKAVPDNEISKQNEKIKNELTKVYGSSSQLLALRIDQMSINSQETQRSRVVGGGVKSPRFLSVKINETTAAAIVNATTWSKFTEYLEDGTSKTFSPENRAKYKIDFVKEDGAWKVYYINMKFLPGQEP